MKFYFRSFSEEMTLNFGRMLGKFLVPGMAVLLSGDLGTGKTLLTRGIGESLGTTRVRSPSFTLVNEYPTGRCTLVHADLYRLKPGDVENLGLQDYLDETCILIVEWPDRWQTPPDFEALRIAIETEGETGRIFRMSSLGTKAESALRGLKEIGLANLELGNLGPENLISET